ncbi:MAG TPA: amidohydrolase family protein [Micromonosporaceae bacterium]
MNAAPLLLRNGHVIDTEPAPTVRLHTDVLVQHGRVVAVGPGLPTPAGVEIIDATDRIVLPGFIDTHRHAWQTAIRAVAVDADLGEYLDLVLGRLGPRYRPQDLRVANLASALECLDGGITTVQDFSLPQHSPQHTEAAVAALREAGIRAVFGYACPELGEHHLGAERARQVRADLLPTDDGLVTMALAVLGPSYAPIDLVEADWRLARELGIRIASHVGSGPVAALPIAALDERDLLGPDTLYVHGNSLPDQELKLIAESGGSVSVAPAVEGQMGHGAPVLGRLRGAGVTTGLGIDVVTTVAGDMFSTMRAALLTSRFGDGPQLTAADVLRMATLDGAAALGLAEVTGSLRPGKQADIMLLRTDTMNMLTAEHDLIGAVVACAHPGNVETVLVGGRVLKRNGTLVHADLARVVAEVRAAAVVITSGTATSS